ncbi:1-acyl-sn-glycerol-3-phosphate acyltransferase [bacterium]|nr:MAG: 1-acyl-sn-glycerol-3-phosphate acyltransferase [bacterium]
MVDKAYHSKIRSFLFISFGLVLTFILVLTAIPISLFAPMGKTMAAIEKFWSGVLVRFSMMRVVAKGMEHIKSDKTYIFICNHQSALDIPLMMFYAPKQLRMIFKKELLYIPFFGLVLWLLKFIPIDRGNREKAITSLKKAAKRIHDGINIVIYADGTRSVNGELKPFKKGAFLLAIDAQVDIIPVTISGTINVMHKFGGILDVKFGQEVHIIFDPPISTSSFVLEQKDELKTLVNSQIAGNYEVIKHLSKITDTNLLDKVTRFEQKQHSVTAA